MIIMQPLKQNKGALLVYHYILIRELPVVKTVCDLYIIRFEKLSYSGLTHE